MEDIIALIDGRPEIVAEVLELAHDELRSYLRRELTTLLANDQFIASIPGHLPPGDRGQARGSEVFARLRALAHA